jgi:hypothetical protein
VAHQREAVTARRSPSPCSPRSGVTHGDSDRTSVEIAINLDEARRRLARVLDRVRERLRDRKRNVEDLVGQRA